MDAKQAWDQFAAYAETGDVEGIQVLLSSMTETEVKSCMSHGASLMRVGLQSQDAQGLDATHGGVIFPAAA
jgi:hypothetical protein